MVRCGEKWLQYFSLNIITAVAVELFRWNLSLLSGSSDEVSVKLDENCLLLH